jgi:polynucleotide 5'-kinase involved in rRNA processing
MEAFDELADNHVDFDELLGGNHGEAALAKALHCIAPARVAVLGPSGSGKSSLIAATLADAWVDQCALCLFLQSKM